MDPEELATEFTAAIANLATAAAAWKEASQDDMVTELKKLSLSVLKETEKHFAACSASKAPKSTRKGSSKI